MNRTLQTLSLGLLLATGCPRNTTTDLDNNYSIGRLGNKVQGVHFLAFDYEGQTASLSLPYVQKGKVECLQLELGEESWNYNSLPHLPVNDLDVVLYLGSKLYGKQRESDISLMVSIMGFSGVELMRERGVSGPCEISSPMDDYFNALEISQGE
jgi:hypothetical protein